MKRLNLSLFYTQIVIGYEFGAGDVFAVFQRIFKLYLIQLGSLLDNKEPLVVEIRVDNSDLYGLARTDRPAACD